MNDNNQITYILNNTLLHEWLNRKIKYYKNVLIITFN